MKGRSSGKVTKVVKINGEVMKLFPISKLVEELNKATKRQRTAQTIRKWEKNKVIPSCSFRIKDRRYYHKAQIDTICRIAKEEHIRQGRDFSSSKFVKRIWEELPKITKELRGERDR